ncbi:hypothetical protein N9924_00020 [bacterium]|nr:hypothetical protein [bacterium]
MATLKKAPAGLTARNFKSVIYTLVKENTTGKKYPPSHEIPEVDEVYMTWTTKEGEEKEGIRQIRYSLGETSIFVDEQSEFAEKKRGTIVLIDGTLVVNEVEATKMKYLELCNYNEANKEIAMSGKSVIFRVNNANYQADQELKKSEKATRLKTLIYGMSDDEAEGLGLSIGLPYVKGVNSVSQLKQRFIQEIDINAEDFEKALKDDKRKLKLVLIRAIEKKIISLDEKTNIIYHEVGGRTVLIEAPSYKDPLEYFVELSCSRDEYKAAFEEVKKLLSNDGTKTAKSKEWEEYPENDLFGRGMKVKVISNSFGNFKMVKHGNLGEKKGRRDAVLYLRQNPEISADLKKMVEDAEKDLVKKP